jgi:hypothetical protein
MRYMLFICDDESRPQPAGIGPETAAWVEEMTHRAIRLSGERLRSVSDATTVRIRDGQTLITDGPFMETKEQIAGYDIIEAADLDEALEVAAKHPMSRVGAIEIRPFWGAE